jgi:hypothetical protein
LTLLTRLALLRAGLVARRVRRLLSLATVAGRSAAPRAAARDRTSGRWRLAAVPAPVGLAIRATRPTARRIVTVVIHD